MLIEPGVMMHGRFVATCAQPGCVWRWEVDDDDAVYSGTAPTEAEAWRQAHQVVDRASPVMVARAEGATAGLDAMRARAEAAEARAAQAEAAGYRRAIDEACALLDEEQLRAWAVSVSPRNDGFATGVRHAMFEVRNLAPVEPVSPADGLPSR